MSEKLNLDQGDNLAGSQWDELAELSNNQSPENKEDKTLPLFTEVVGGYKISSMPFDDKKDAYDEIDNYWQGDGNVTTYFKDGKWYIISK